MVEVHTEHRAAILALIKSRLIWRRLRHRPDVIEATARKLSEANDPNPYFDWSVVISMPNALREAMVGSKPYSVNARKVRPFDPKDVGLDFEDQEWFKRAWAKAVKLAAREVRRGRGYSISGFHFQSVYDFSETTTERLSIEDAAKVVGAPARLIERALGFGDFLSLRPADVEAYRSTYERLAQTVDDYTYNAVSVRVLQDLGTVKPRPDYSLREIGGTIFDYVRPTTVHDILYSWSYGFLTTAEASKCLHLGPGEDLAQVAIESNVPLPVEEAMSRNEVAERLGMSVDDVQHLIANHGLESCRRPDVEARAAFQREKWGGQGTLADLEANIEADKDSQSLSPNR